MGRLLWDKDLGLVLNGNISLRVDEKSLLITATKTSFGFLEEKDIILSDMDGNPLEPGQISSEKRLHLDIYRNFPDVTTIIHTHTVFINAFFLENKKFAPRIHEAKFWFGEIEAVPQDAPNVTDTAPVIEKFKTKNVAVLGNHGVIATGKNLMDCFFLIQGLEEAVKIETYAALFREGAGGKGPIAGNNGGHKQVSVPRPSHKLFSREQIDAIVALVNADAQMKEMGAKTDMTMTLAVKSDETGKVFRFVFEKGRIVDVSESEDAEFVINAPESVWRAVFRRELDPFIATTQKKMILKGDFGKISKFYAPCNRLFDLWTKVEIE